jgi:DNA-binding response OmpR family regulator
MNGAMRTMLIVDDEPSLLRAMSDYFLLRGFAVDCATEMEEAQAMLDCRSYSVLICDIALKSFIDAAGLEVISHLRSNSGQARIIILTGAWQDDLTQRVRELEIDEVLIKPQPLWRIAEVIERLLAGETKSYADAS